MSGKTRPRKPRAYDNTVRSQKSEAARETILKALIKLLVKKRGGEVAIEEVAIASGVSKRTIFRFFKDKTAMHEELDKYLMAFVQTSFEQLKQMDVNGFGKNAYATFDRHEDLVMAYLYSPVGQQARQIFRKRLNQMIISKILADRGLQESEEIRKRLALIVSLVNAKIWLDIRADFGFSGEAMGDAVSWALKTLMDALDATLPK